MEYGLRFGRFEIDLDAGELRRSGRRVKLQPRPFRILVLLASRSGTVVTREEIRRHVWGTDTWVDFDHNVSFCIHQIRLALSDRTLPPRFVETLPRRGYRFVATLERVARPAPESPAIPASRRHLQRAAAVAALSLLTLGLAVGQEGSLLATPRPTSAGRAAYLRGLYLRQSGATRSEDAARAFEEAVRLDPGRAEAHSALAQVYVEIADAGLRPAREVMALAELQAREALRLDASLAPAQVALGTAQLAGAWDWEGARVSFERALTLDSRLVAAHTAWAAYLSARGDQEGAIAAIRRAQALDPVCPVVRGDAGWYYYCARRFADAASEWQKAVAIDPSSPGAHERLVRAYRHAARIDEAVQEARRTMRLVGVSDPRLADLTLFSRGTARWLERSPAPGPDALERRAALYASMGESQRALEALETACDRRSRFLLRHLGVDPDLDALRNDPRYQSLLRRVGLQRI